MLSLNHDDHVDATSGPYDLLLPASYRTPDDDIAVPTLTTSFLQKELGVKRLNDIHRWMWIVGRPMPPRPLYHQKAIGRQIVVHEQMDLHLVWDEQRIFLKPIPPYLFEQSFWRDILSCDGHELASGSRQACTRPEDSTHFKEMTHFPDGDNCDRCELRKLATGFTLTYTSLIAYESDLSIAKKCNLVPEEMTWPQWRSLVKSLLSTTLSSDHPASSPRNHAVNPRYHYGELRLNRLNLIYRLTLRAPIRGYLYGHNSYHQFWTANMQRLAAAFAYTVVVLTAMQMGLETDRLGENKHFQNASYGFAVFSIVAPLVLLGLTGVLFLGVFTVNWVISTRYWMRRMVQIEKGNERIGAIP
ncbi:MAG: hypothetical protein Q9216_007218 [Gyalolechia sp. 2 TL-2023]